MYKYRCVIPDIPEVSEYYELLQRIHNADIYSNFGPLYSEFQNGLEAKYANIQNDEKCICVNSATTGISAALIAANINGNVIMPAFTFPATYGAIKAASCKPVLIDVDENTWLPDLGHLIEQVKLNAAQAVILLKPFGIHTDLNEYLNELDRLGIIIIIDNAAGMGIQRPNQTVSETIFEVYSFHATKPFGIGEGGGIFTHENNAEKIKNAVNFGLPNLGSNNFNNWGFNGKISEFHSAIGIAQLKRFAESLIQRQNFAKKYIEILTDRTDLFFHSEHNMSPWQMFPVLFPDSTSANNFISSCANSGLEIRKYYNPSISLISGINCYGSCPVSESLSQRMCMLPIRSGKAYDQIDDIINIVKDSFYA